MSSTIEADVYLPHPVETVWQALVDPAKLARWLMRNDFLPATGREFTFRTLPVPAQRFDGVVHCVVLALVPDSTLRMSWADGAATTVLTWRLMDEGRGTRLFITHTGFDDTDPAQRAAMNRWARGWRGQFARRLRECTDAA